MEIINYSRAAIAGQATGASVSHTTETDLLKVTDPRFSDKSQLTLYIDQVLSTATKVSYGIYFSFDGGVSWYKLPVEDLTTNKGELVDIPPYVDSSSPAQSTHVRTIYNVPIPACTAFKITGLAATNDAGAYILTATVRDN